MVFTIINDTPNRRPFTRIPESTFLTKSNLCDSLIIDVAEMHVAASFPQLPFSKGGISADVVETAVCPLPLSF
jgi:hypothetical protein